MPQRDPGVYLEDIEHCAAAETIPHARDIIGFRNILAHGYAELDHNEAPAVLQLRQVAMHRTGNSVTKV